MARNCNGLGPILQTVYNAYMYVMNGSLSNNSAFSLKQRVPQGSCLGPLLFTAYINTLFDNVSNNQAYIAKQTIHSCIWRLVPQCKGIMRLRFALLLTAYTS